MPKALVEISGRTLLEHCLGTACAADLQQTVVVAPPTHLADVEHRVRPFGCSAVPGGATRSDSVRAGLAALAVNVRFVLVHDAARPFTPLAVYERVITALRGGQSAVIPVLPVVDTVKQVSGGQVVRTVPRDDLVAVQTPQGFDRGVLAAAHARRADEVTDDAMLVERSGAAVSVVPGSPEAFKITTQFDLAVATALVEGRR